MKELSLSQQYAVIALDGQESLHPSVSKSAVIRGIAAAKVLEEVVDTDEECRITDFVSKLNEAVELAKSLNIDLEKLQDDANSLDTMHKIQADIDEAYSNHINGTPSTIINGKPHVGMKPYSEFKKWLKDEGATEK